MIGSFGSIGPSTTRARQGLIGHDSKPLVVMNGDGMGAHRMVWEPTALRERWSGADASGRVQVNHEPAEFR